MKVKLMAFTQNPEIVCAKAMMGCQARTMAADLDISYEKAVEMINKALDLEHLSILEHASFTFSISGVSRSCTHQLVRHRIASYSQTSGRARDWSKLSPNDFVMPDTIQEEMKLEVSQHFLESVRLYTRLVGKGVPGEDARFVLPIAMPQNIVVTMNARELLHFFYLRLSPKVQWEIRELARRMLELVREVAPFIFARAGVYKC